MAVDDAGHHRAQLRSGGVAGQEGEGGIPLEHFALGRPDHSNLEEMIHDRDRREPALVSGLSDLRQGVAEPSRTSRPREIGDVQP